MKTKNELLKKAETLNRLSGYLVDRLDAGDFKTAAQDIELITELAQFLAKDLKIFSVRSQKCSTEHSGLKCEPS